MLGVSSSRPAADLRLFQWYFEAEQEAHVHSHTVTNIVSMTLSIWYIPLMRLHHAPFYQEKTSQADMMLLSPEASVWYEVTNGRRADLPLQRLSHTHRGWQMARDGFWSLPPGDVSAGCQTNTPDTWTASAEGAAPVLAPHYHGNLLCNEIQAHLVGRFIEMERCGEESGRWNMQ